MRPALGITALLMAALLLASAPRSARAEESLIDKIKKVFATPTPTPKHRKHSTTKRKSTPTPSPHKKRKSSTPTPTPEDTPRKRSSSRKKSKPSPTPEEEETASPTPKKSTTASSKSKRRKKSSPTPSPSPLPSETPEESPSPTESPSASPTPSETPTPEKEKDLGNATISTDQIKGYDDYPATVRKIVDLSLALTKQNLKYSYGSADPSNGGLDCSGFVYYVLRKAGFDDVPRDSSAQYVWVRKAGNFRAVLSREADTFELDGLKPGDLLFWTGTYSIERDPPVTHAMIYLGREKESGKRIMVGASDGRSYDGKQRYGVSLFDFKLSKPKPSKDAKLSPLFVGYGSVPGLVR